APLHDRVEPEVGGDGAAAGHSGRPPALLLRRRGPGRRSDPAALAEDEDLVVAGKLADRAAIDQHPDGEVDRVADQVAVLDTHPARRDVAELDRPFALLRELG